MIANDQTLIGNKPTAETTTNEAGKLSFWRMFVTGSIESNQCRYFDELFVTGHESCPNDNWSGKYRQDDISRSVTQRVVKIIITAVDDGYVSYLR